MPALQNLRDPQTSLLRHYSGFSDKLKTGARLRRGSLETLGETRRISASIGGKIISPNFTEVAECRRKSKKNSEFFTNGVLAHWIDGLLDGIVSSFRIVFTVSFLTLNGVDDK